jgi:hypothetical protein
VAHQGSKDAMDIKKAKSINRLFMIHFCALLFASISFLVAPYIWPVHFTLSCSLPEHITWWDLAKPTYIECNARDVYHLSESYYLFAAALSLSILVINFRGFRIQLPISLYKDPKSLLTFFIIYSAFIYYFYDWTVSTQAYVFESREVTPDNIYNHVVVILASCLVIPAFNYLFPFFFGKPKDGQFNIEPVETYAVRSHTSRWLDDGS